MHRWPLALPLAALALLAVAVAVPVGGALAVLCGAGLVGAVHRDYFLPPEGSGGEDAHAEPPTIGQTRASFGLLLASLVAVVGLGKVLSPSAVHVVLFATFLFLALVP